MHDDHEHEGHHHDHGEDGSELSEMALRIRALESILTEKGYIDPASLDLIVDRYETQIGPRNGASVVARAWTEPEFLEWLRHDATGAINAMGYSGYQAEHMVVVENTPTTHNIVVCSLCSCYPWPVLGLPPSWYKSFAYRSRVVADPRVVLAELGLTLDPDVTIRVWDSLSEARYLVIPMRPAGTEGWSAAQLAELVSRDSMIGAAMARTPGQAPA